MDRDMILAIISKSEEKCPCAISSPSKLFATIDSDIGFSLHRNSPVGAAFALDSCPCWSKTQSYSGTLPNRRSKCVQPTRSGNTLPVIAGGSILPRQICLPTRQRVTRHSYLNNAIPHGLTSCSFSHAGRRFISQGLSCLGGNSMALWFRQSKDLSRLTYP
ncbi:hypothetical protein V1478_000440 [Vespula squamosa]|uniref:Uncharacterized protein n=1 Tax=Vespula squamosa TaxID=30214 RepID=A0ABD2C5L5_VESSQ